LLASIKRSFIKAYCNLRVIEMMGTIRALTVFAMFWVPSVALAAVVQVDSEAELIQKSDAIVMGTVASVVAHAQPQGGVVTTAEVRVFRSLRGAGPGETISVVVPGGTLKNGLTSYVAGSPIPQVGAWVVLLLESKASSWTPKGLALGWIQLKGSASQGFVAYRELDGIDLVGSSGGPLDSRAYQIRAQRLEDLWVNLESHLISVPSPSTGEVKQ
jgi:hypothetical protein